MSGARDGHVSPAGGKSLGSVDRVGEDVGIGVAAEVKHGYGQRLLHRLHETPALGAKLAAHRPALILQRGVRRGRDLDGAAHVRHRLREVLGCLPLAAGSAAHEEFEIACVVAGERSLRPKRHLVAQHRGQKGQALVAPTQRRRTKRDGMRRADQADGLHRPWMQDRRRPTHQAAVGVPDQDRPRMPECTNQTRDVAGQGPAVVAPWWFVAAAVSA